MWLSESHQEQLPLNPNSQVFNLFKDPERLNALARWIEQATQVRLAQHELQSVKIAQTDQVQQQQSSSVLSPKESPKPVLLTELPGVELTVEIWGLDRFTSFETKPPTLENPPHEIIEVMKPVGRLAQRWSQLYGDGRTISVDRQESGYTEKPGKEFNQQPAKAVQNRFGTWLNAPTQRPATALAAPKVEVASQVELSESSQIYEPALEIKESTATSGISQSSTSLPSHVVIQPPAQLPPITIEPIQNESESLRVWQLHEEQLRKCHACYRSQSRVENDWSVVGGVGSHHPKVMFVESHPSVFAAISGLPLADPAIVHDFSKTLHWLGLSRHSVYTTSLLKCSTADPTPAEWKECRTHFERELKLVQPKLIVTLGTLTIQILLNQATPLLGEWCEIDGVPVFGTHHFRDVVSQADRLKRLMGDHLRRLKIKLDQLKEYEDH